MKIEQLRIKNFKILKDIHLKDIPNMCVFLGANGSGKSTLFDVFSFLSEALKSNVQSAVNNRGGFSELISRNSSLSDKIEIIVKFRNDPLASGLIINPPLITYHLEIGLMGKTPVVSREVLSYRRGSHGKPYHFIDFQFGQGEAISNEEDIISGKANFEPIRVQQTLDAPYILAIKGLGQFKEFKAVSDFRKLLENWYIANFQIPDAKKSQEIYVSEHLTPTGDNLALVADYLYENHNDIFNSILLKMKSRIPGISKVEAAKTEDGRIILKFKDGEFKDPFISRFVSDGTLKMFAYLVLLNDPVKRPLLCIEEPENYLHPFLMSVLSEEFREYSSKGQIFISTHSPDFVNTLNIDELFWLHKSNGFSIIKRAMDDETVSRLFREGDKLGYLWRQNFLIGSGPNEI